MTQINLESDGDKMKCEINGRSEELIDMIATAIIQDENFGILVLTAIAAIASKKTNPLKNINLN